MPTSSEKLRARSRACLKACDAINKLAEDADDVEEAEALYRAAKRMWLDHGRYKKLADDREEKEQLLEHRRKR